MLPGTQILDSTGGTMIHSPIGTQVILERFPDGRVQNEFEISGQHSTQIWISVSPI